MQRKLGDPKERLKSESEGIVLSPQRRSFNSGCQVTLTTKNEGGLQERGTNDKGSNRSMDRDFEGTARDRNRDARTDHRGERNDKDDYRISRREGGDTDDGCRGGRPRGVGSGRILNRSDRERGDDYSSSNDRGARNERISILDQGHNNLLDRNDFRDRTAGGMQDTRRGMPPGGERFDRRDGREDSRDLGTQGNNSRFPFRGERNLDGPRERLRREIEQADQDFERGQRTGRGVGDSWHNQNIKELELRRERNAGNHPGGQGGYERNYSSKNERRDGRNFESERSDQGGRLDFQPSDQGGGGGYQHHGYGGSRRDQRGGSRFGHRRSETEEPEWMSESIEMGDMMELRGFDDSPEKDAFNSSEGNNVELTTLLHFASYIDPSHYPPPTPSVKHYFLHWQVNVRGKIHRCMGRLKNMKNLADMTR